MANLPSIPSLSSRIPAEVSALLRPMREILTAFTSGDHQVVKMRDLRELGILPPEGPGNGGLDLGATPPMPTGLTISGALATIIMAWDATNFAKLSHTEIWRAQVDDFSVAQLVGRSDGRVYVDNVGGAAIRYYWIRYVSVANVAGPFNAQRGTRGETGVDPAYLLSLLTGQITESQLYNKLGEKISLITAPASTAGSVAQRIATETLARTEAITVEAKDRAAAVAAEAKARSDALVSEATNRSNAIAAETAIRNQAIAVESSLRDQAIRDEAQLRITGLLAEAAARGTAIGKETTLRTEADSVLAEEIQYLVAANNTAVAAFGQSVAAMTVGDAAIASRLQTLTAQTASDIAAAILEEATVRTNADQAEAAARSTLQAQLTGGYGGNNLEGVVSGLLHQERVARATKDGALALQMSLLSAGVGGGFDPYKTWYFDGSAEGWSGGGAPVTARDGNLVVTSTSIFSPPIALMGAQYATVKARVTRKAGAGWAGSLVYSTNSHGFEATYVKTVAQAIAIGQTVVIDWDMTTLNSGSTDWTSSTITGLRLDLGASSADAFDIDWIATGRNAPAASVASLSEEATARAQADSAEVTARQALSTRVLGVADPAVVGSVANLASGLLHEERTLRTTADVSLGSRIDTLSTTVNANTATITNEVKTRADADSAMSTRIDAVTATSGANTAAITSEQKARADADAALTELANYINASTASSLAAVQLAYSAQTTADTAMSTRIESLIAKTASDIQAVIVEEQTVRATANSAMATRIDTVTATVGANTAAIVAEQGARADAVSSLTTRVDAVMANTGANAAAILAEQKTRTDANTALATRIDTVTGTVGANTAAIVAEQKVRASADSALSTRVDTISATTGTNEAAILAEKKTRTDADQALAELANYINASTASSLAAVQLAYSAQTTSDTAMSHRIESLVASTAAEIEAAIVEEQTVRAIANTAMAEQINTISAKVGANAAAIITEQTARVDEAGALSRRLDTLNATVGVNAAAIVTEQKARVDADGTTATEIKQLQAVVTNPDTGLVDRYAAVKVIADATVTALGKVQTQYTVNVDVDGVAGGFGIIGTGDKLVKTIDFGVRASTVYIAAPSGAGIEPSMPFIVRTAASVINGVNVPAGVYIADGFIANGTINNAKIGDAAIDNAKIASLDAGKITTGYIDAARIKANSITAGLIDTRGLTIKALDGSIILGAGIGLSYNAVVGGPPANATAGAAFGVNITGQIASWNATTYIADGAIGTAQIGNAAINNAKIADAAITTAKIANASITSAQIQDAAIETAKIADGSIVSAKIADASIGSAKIADAAITGAKIGTAEIDTLLLKGNAVTVMSTARGSSTAEISVYTHGAPVFLAVSGSAQIGGKNPFPAEQTSVDGSVTVTISRDGVDLASGTAFGYFRTSSTVMVVDTPSGSLANPVLHRYVFTINVGLAPKLPDFPPLPEVFGCALEAKR